MVTEHEPPLLALEVVSESNPYEEAERAAKEAALARIAELEARLKT